jgi:hypothetical protein
MSNPIETKKRFDYFVEHAQEGMYLTVPFNMPEDTESFSLAYRYGRHLESECEVENGSYISRREINIVDLGLIAPDGRQVGASGSDKNEIRISETWSTPGCQRCALVPGEWQILLGAYKVAAEGVMVQYELTFTPKRLRLFKGDLHTHTLASDGVLMVKELAQHALRHGLDFLAITDHNQMVQAETLPQIPGMTLIPGIEWTHYQGHANFLGVDRPYDEPFFANSMEEVQKRFASARKRGALITINHPYDEICPFKFDVNSIEFDCLEIWNGPMRESNLRALGMWDGMLSAGKKVPICAGSDYHRSQLFLFPGGPTTCVLAMSASTVDILSGLKQGHAYLVYAPDGPRLEMTAGEATLGDCVQFPKVRELQVISSGLLAGDLLQVVTNNGNKILLTADNPGTFQGNHRMEEAGFARIEIWREFIPGLPLLPALISNPIYFEAEKSNS